MAEAKRSFVGGIMGDPVAHSRSPLIHDTWCAQHGIDGRYVKLAIKPAGLAAALRALPALGFAGVNLTIPHKEPALALLDVVDATARRIGAVNLVVVAGEGRLIGRNTDGYGFMASILEAAPAWQASAGPAVVLGAGGAARAIVTSLLDAGASEVRLVNRSQERAGELARDAGAAVRVIDWRERHAALGGAALLVNTTSLGMAGEPPLDLTLDDLPRAAIVVDIVYVPLETPLLTAARARGHTAVDGLGMLLHQAVPTFEALFGVRPAVTPGLRDKVVASLC
jgi:shikimate dehydrogenase